MINLGERPNEFLDSMEAPIARIMAIPTIERYPREDDSTHGRLVLSSHFRYFTSEKLGKEFFNGKTPPSAQDRK
jgi:hypothetical protein